ncbi:putative dihydrolipoamide dehydrogenase [Skeletonema marinoi]|uniref:Dihydrolipoamide dehydrogenase n=1 Tax=Skeletonema marinoi TaxID=267567 RepID=A0AAD8XSU8_9STRA|nr:putative dihydrolipoamide dehydrogenase [Skeletonema marinoi]
MKISAAAAALLSLALPTATAWTVSRQNSAMMVSSVHRSASMSIRSPSLLQSTTVKDAAMEEVAAAEAAAPASTNPEIFGTVSSSKLNKLYDLVVIGGGPAGVAGAIKAAQMGRRAIVIDKPKFDAGVLPNGLDLFFGGPTGLFSKALRDLAKTTNVAAMRAQHMDSDVIWKQITNGIVKLAMRNSEGQCRTLARYGIDYLQGSAMLLGEDDEANKAAESKFEDDMDSPEDGLRSVNICDAKTIDEDGNLVDSNLTVTGTKVLVCTGSKSTRLPGIPFEESHRIFDSDTINLLGYFPRSVTISGLGIIGIEFANIFNALGVKDVNILVRGDVETSTKKLGMDMDVANELMRLLTESGVKVLEGTSVTDDEYIEMKLNDGSTMQTDLFFAATGRYPVGKNEETGLESAGVEVADRGMVGIDKKTLATSSKNVYAAGDVIGPPALASTSMEQAQRAVSAMFHEGDDDVTKDANHDDPLSIGVWTIPEMGYFGLTKEQAEKEGYSVVEGTARFDQCLRGRVFAPDGLCKLVVDEKEGTVLGCHLIGKEAAEMVHYGMALVKAGTSIFEILQTVYTAVTFHELFKEAALDANSKLDFGVEWQEIFAILQAECDVDFSEDYLREKFDSIDEDGSGELDEEEMGALFGAMGRTVSKRIIANIMRLSDTDGNGTIDFGEFKAIFDKIGCPRLKNNCFDLLLYSLIHLAVESVIRN